MKIPTEYQKAPSNPPPNGKPEPVRYQEAFEAFWWNCVIVKANDLDADCPSDCSGTPAAVAGCSDGAFDADDKIEDLLTKYSQPEVMLYLNSLASSKKAKKKILPYFQETPRRQTGQ